MVIFVKRVSNSNLYRTITLKIEMHFDGPKTLKINCEEFNDM